MPASGSSSSSTRGAVARHIAISSWRLAPWLRVPAVRAASGRQAGGVERLAGRGEACAQSLAARSQNAQGRGARACAARRQFSSTLNSRKMVVRW